MPRDTIEHFNGQEERRINWLEYASRSNAEFFTKDDIALMKLYTAMPFVIPFQEPARSFLVDALITESHIEELEFKHSMPPRSAKAVLRMLLRTGRGNRAAPEKSTAVDDMIDEMSSGDAPNRFHEACREYKMTEGVATVFLAMYQSPDYSITSERLLAILGVNGFSNDDSSLKAAICKVRKKVAADYLVENIWGHGYKLVAK